MVCKLSGHVIRVLIAAVTTQHLSLRHIHSCLLLLLLHYKLINY